MRIGIIILNWNGKLHTLACIESLVASRDTLLCILIVDNGSKDGTVDALMRWGKRQKWEVHIFQETTASGFQNILPVMFGREEIYILQLDKNVGYTKGNNIGIKWFQKSGADAVLILNNDTWVTSEAIFRMEETIKKSSAIGIVGCKIMNYNDDGFQYQGGGNLSYWLGVHYLRRFKGHPKGDVKVNFVPGCAMLIRMSVLNALGGFRDDFFAYTDDIEFCHRVRQAGWTLMLNLDTFIRHKLSQATGGRRTALYYYFVTRNTLIFIIENLRGLQQLVALIMFIFARLLQMILWTSSRHWGRIKGVIMGVIDFVRGVRGPGWATRFLKL